LATIRSLYGAVQIVVQYFYKQIVFTAQLSGGKNVLPYGVCGFSYLFFFFIFSTLQSMVANG